MHQKTRTSPKDRDQQVMLEKIRSHTRTKKVSATLTDLSNRELGLFLLAAYHDGDPDRDQKLQADFVAKDLESLGKIFIKLLND